VIISQTPYRVSFAGWGTDLPAYYRWEFGALITKSSAKHWAHDLSGWLMLALALVGLEIGVLSWLVPREDKIADDVGKSLLAHLSEKSK
jgi:hypothetical protein